MTSTATPTTAPAPSTPAVPAAVVATRRGADTPTRMRVLAVLAAVVTAVFGIVGSAVVADRTSELGDARDAAAQLSLLEAVRSAVVEADSLATSAYLAGGLEPAERRATYEARLAAAERGLVEAAAGALPDESERLGAVASMLGDASGRVEQARANSRQGYPVGAAYQRSSSALLRSDVLPVIDEIAAATEERVVVAVEGDATPAVVIGLGALAVLGVLALASRWMFGRTNRVINPGLAVAAVAIGGSALATLWSGVAATGSAVDTIDSDYASAAVYARARTAAFDAKSNEALTLIARGNGGAFEARWAELSAQAVAYLERADDIGDPDAAAALSAYRGYLSSHVAIRSADDGGDHDGAVQAALAIGDGDDFAIFDAATGRALDTRSSATDAALAAARDDVAVDRWIVLVVALVAAAAAFAGIAPRIQEYR